eukprot:18104-Rhodomonas_salina.2
MAFVPLPGENDTARINHPKPASFFVRPSKRPAADVKAKYADAAKLRAELEKTDPEGVRRLEGAYNSVGLRFFPRSSEKEDLSENGLRLEVMTALLVPVAVVLGVLLVSRIK